MDLDRLRGLPGAPEAEAAWAGQATAGPGDDCDAQIVPIVTGRVDPGVLDRLAAVLLHDRGRPRWQAPPDQTGPPPQTSPATPTRRGGPGRAGCAAVDLEGRGRLAVGAWRARVLLADAAGAGTVASVSLPLDVGALTETIPVHLRRASRSATAAAASPAASRAGGRLQQAAPHRCRAPRAAPTCLTNLIASVQLFRHFVAVHRWGSGIGLHRPNGTVAATSSPDGQKSSAQPRAATRRSRLTAAGLRSSARDGGDADQVSGWPPSIRRVTPVRNMLVRANSTAPATSSAVPMRRAGFFAAVSLKY